jgi:hypothetical protein
MPAVGMYLSLDRVSELLAKRGAPATEPRAAVVGSLKEALLARKRGAAVRVVTP